MDRKVRTRDPIDVKKPRVWMDYRQVKEPCSCDDQSYWRVYMNGAWRCNKCAEIDESMKDVPHEFRKVTNAT